MLLGKKKLVMMTKHVTKYPELHEIHVIGGDAKGTHIVERYENTAGGTKVIIDAEIRLGKLASIIPKKTTSDFEQMISEFAKIAET
jgi:coenzyme Q-binding protein COQ10